VNTVALTPFCPLPLQFKDSVSNKVQETFSLKLEEPAPTTPTPPPAGGGKKKKGGKKDKSGAAASAASE
jgi:hypothetical protein